MLGKEVVWLEEPVHTRAGRLLTAFTVILTVFLMLLLSLFVVYKGTGLKICHVEGESMLPTVKENATLLLNPETEIRRFDIIVFETGERYLIKRVIGLPGDDIHVEDGVLYVNGKAHGEPYLDAAYCTEFLKSSFDVQVPDGNYFVMGDNRDNSMDSRDIGTVPENRILGVPILSFDK